MLGGREREKEMQNNMYKTVQKKMKRQMRNKTPKGFIRTAVPLPCQKAAKATLGVSRAVDPKGTMSYSTQGRNSFCIIVQIFESRF